MKKNLILGSAVFAVLTGYTLYTLKKIERTNLNAALKVTDDYVSHHQGDPTNAYAGRKYIDLGYTKVKGKN